VPNQFEISDCNIDYFQSYETIICKRVWDDFDNDCQIFLDKKFWNYSRTTGKYRNYFLGECVADTRKKIESGEYQLTELN